MEVSNIAHQARYFVILEHKLREILHMDQQFFQYPRDHINVTRVQDGRFIGENIAVEVFEYLLQCGLLITQSKSLQLKTNLFITLINCMLGNCAFFFVVCYFFSKLKFSIKSFRNMIKVSNSLDPDQARRFVGPDLGPNCLQRLSADDIGRQRVNTLHGRLINS